MALEDTDLQGPATGITEVEDNRTEGIKGDLSDQNEKDDYDVYMMSDVLRTHSLFKFLLYTVILK